MSILPKEAIEVIAQSVGINNLSVDAALTLAPDVEYRMRELMQEAIKCMRHSRRTILTTDDVDTALNIRNVEPVYGFASGDPLRFKRAVGHMDLFYIEDKDVDFKDIIEAPLPKAPLDTSIMCHWLAIEGVQPAIPENAPVQGSETKDDGLPIDIKVPVQHVLSRELQLYFDKITELTIRGSETVLFKEALVSLATDAGLHPLVPYFTCFIADEVSPCNFQVLQDIFGNSPTDIQCCIMSGCTRSRFGHAYGNLQPRLTRTLVNAFLDPKRAITQHYGAIQGLAALGPNVVRHLILPNLKPYLQLLESEMLLESQKNEMKRHEAWRVYGALLHAAGQCIYDRLKKFPVLPSPPHNEVWGKKDKINTLAPGKRKATMEQSEEERKDSMDCSEEPPLKRVATDGPLMDNNTSPSVKQNEVDTAASSSGASDLPSTSEQMATTTQNEGSRNETSKNDKEALKLSAVMNQVWKDDLNSGQVLVSMLELFGESIFPFIPALELSMFL
ncbi:Transcription initiation factor TFIID subunit 6 [Bienertia sinuspersici]